MPRATDLVVYKMIAARPTDLQDVATLLAGGAIVDRGRVRTLLREFDELLGLERALEWERLLGRLTPRP